LEAELSSTKPSKEKKKKLTILRNLKKAEAIEDYSTNYKYFETHGSAAESPE
jgi:hypothetical protein